MGVYCISCNYKYYDGILYEFWKNTVVPFLGTCRIPYPNLTVYYINTPPYVGLPKPGETKPSGMLIELFEKSLFGCFHTCSSFKSKISLHYVSHMNRTKMKKDFVLPVPLSNKVKPKYEEIELIQSPGSLLIEAPLPKDVILAENEKDIINEIIATLPLVALYFIVNTLFGILFWFIVSTFICFHMKLFTYSLI